MRVLEVNQASGLALCSMRGERRQTVDIGILDAVAPGDTLVVHGQAAVAAARLAGSGRSCEPVG